MKKAKSNASPPRVVTRAWKRSKQKIDTRDPANVEQQQAAFEHGWSHVVNERKRAEEYELKRADLLRQKRELLKTQPPTPSEAIEKERRLVDLDTDIAALDAAFNNPEGASPRNGTAEAGPTSVRDELATTASPRGTAPRVFSTKTARSNILTAVIKRAQAAVADKLDCLPRMADFGRVLAALDELHGTKSFSSYLAQRGRVVEDVLEADRVGAAVRELVEWQGTSEELLVKITPEGTRPREWPATPRALSARLKRLKPALEEVGTMVVFHTERTNKGRLIDIGKRTSQPSQPSPSDDDIGDGRVTVGDSSDGREILSTAAAHRGSDDSDCSDGVSPSLNSEADKVIEAEI